MGQLGRAADFSQARAGGKYKGGSVPSQPASRRSISLNWALMSAAPNPTTPPQPLPSRHMSVGSDRPSADRPPQRTKRTHVPIHTATLSHPSQRRIDTAKSNP